MEFKEKESPRKQGTLREQGIGGGQDPTINLILPGTEEGVYSEEPANFIR